MQDLWLKELSRVLKPGGVLLLTIYGTVATQILDVREQQRLQADGFIHKRSEKLKGFVPDWYQTSWHSSTYMIDRLEKAFREVRYCPVPDGIQDIVMARKAI